MVGNRMAKALIFVVLLGFARIWAQQNSEVSPRDSTDWWSILSPTEELDSTTLQHRELAGRNFQILGIDVRHFDFADVEKKLGSSAHIGRGDASTSREQLCYVSPVKDHPKYLIFEQGEVASSVYLFSVDRPWNGRDLCSRSRQITQGVKTGSGLELGLSMSQVIRILGAPSRRVGEDLEYWMSVTKPTSLKDLARIRSQHPELSDEEIRREYGHYDFNVFIKAKFNASGMVYLAIVTTETT